MARAFPLTADDAQKAGLQKVEDKDKSGPDQNDIEFYTDNKIMKQLCYIGPCDTGAHRGYRLVCYLDANLGCYDCYWVPDTVCS